MNMRNTVQCSGSIITPAGGDENDDHYPAGFFMPWDGERWMNFVCILANLHFVVLRFP